MYKLALFAQHDRIECMYIDVVPNRKSRPAFLLRESYREGDKVRKRTLANLSSLSEQQIDAIRTVLKGEPLYPAETLLDVIASRPHGHVEAASVAMSKLGVPGLLSRRPCREQALVLAMIAARILAPQTKLATTRWWQTTTLADAFGVADATEDELYEAMDWLLERQPAIEAKLAARHLEPGGLVLYDLSSSYFEGTTCPLAKRGYRRDSKKGKLQVNYGLLTDPEGRPVAISVYEGNTADASTVLPQVQRVRDDFGVMDFVLVGDRGMLSHKAISELREHDGIGWVTALKSASIRALVEQDALQMDLFDERNLFELTHPDYPGERLIACRNPDLARLRAHKRESLLQATERDLDKVRASVSAGRLRGQDAIGVRVGKVLNKYKVGKHIELDIRDDAFRFVRNTSAIAAEAALDGLYVVRTSLSAEKADSAQCVRYYKLLSQVERGFRSLKTIDLHVRPIHHRLEDRVRAHIFLCMLAHYVEWHLREAWRELLFADEDQAAKQTRDPVAPAKRSAAADAKVSRRQHADGTPVHSFHTLLAELSTIVRNTARAPGGEDAKSTFEVITVANPLQQRALDLARQIAV